MKKHIYFILFFCFYINFGFSQKETANWYFGYYAGVNFASIPPTVLTNSAMYQVEGSASISDKNGNLLFYTNGVYLYNKNHQIMYDSGIIELYGHQSTAQCLIVPMPEDSNKYFIFSLDSYNSDNPQDISYSVIDMSLNSGKGKLIQKNNPICEGRFAEGVTTVKHCNKKDIWVLFISYPDKDLLELESQYPNNDVNIYSFLLTKNGLSTSPVISKVTVSAGGDYYANSYYTYLKASVDGKTIAFDGGVIYADFDNATGIANNFRNPEKKIFESNGEKAYFNYALEFSPNGKYIYNSYGYQIDVSTGAVEKYVDFSKIYPTGLGMQMALDGKIYLNLDSFLAVINYPNLPVPMCNYEKKAVYMGTKENSMYSIPNFMPSLFDTTPKFSYTGECPNKTINFSFTDTLETDSALWLLDDGSPPISGYFADYSYSEPGSYEARLVIYKAGIPDTLSQCVTINGTFLNFLGNDTTVCDKDSTRLSVQYPAIGTYLWNTGVTSGSIFVKSPGTYWARVENDCSTFTDTIVVTQKTDCPILDTTSIFFVPNVFSPNHDGINDLLTIALIGEDINPETIIGSIYNRWGDKVFTSNPLTSPWDGTINGNPTSEGVYFYTIQYSKTNNDIGNQNGFIQLVR